MFIRSTAAGGRLGGLAPATRAAAQALAAAFDVVVIETVGVGQSETEVADVADTVAVIVQPGSGDALQFLKSGIMEVPDVLVVTKADLGVVAHRARRDLGAALRSLGARDTPVVAVSSIAPVQGVDDLIAAIDAHRARLDVPAAPGCAPRRGAHRLRGRARRTRPARRSAARRAARRLLAAQQPGGRRPYAGARARGRGRDGGSPGGSVKLESWQSQLALMVGVFVVATLLAELFGAANLGVAVTVGELAFAATYMFLILKR